MIQVTIDGRLTAQPEVRFSQAGKPWATLTIVSNERRMNKQTNEWEDANTSFLRCKMFGTRSEPLAAFNKGELVIATGKLVQNDYEDKEGNKRQSMELIIETIGAVPRNAPTAAPQTPPGGAGAASWGTGVPNASTGSQGAAQDAWAQPGGTNAYGNDETPF